MLIENDYSVNFADGSEISKQQESSKETYIYLLSKFLKARMKFSFFSLV